MTDLVFHVAGEPVLVWDGSATLHAVACETLVSASEPALELWLYDTRDRGAMAAGSPYARALNGRARVLDTGLATHYAHGIMAILMPMPRTAPSPVPIRTLTFSLWLTWV